MARLLGPDANGRLVYAVSAAGAMQSAADAEAVVYAAATGTTAADILAYDGTSTPGAAIEASTLTVDADSLLPQFWLPDAVATVYVSVAGGTRVPVNADSAYQMADHVDGDDPHGDRAYAAGHDVAGDATDHVNRPATGTEGTDLWQAQYAGSRGAYVNGYGCARARVPAHADAANQVAFRSACHSSKDGTAQVIDAAALSDNTHLSETRANGEWRVTSPRWLDATLGADITAGTAVAPGTAREGSRIYARGTLAWEAATIGSSSTLMVVDAEHRPATAKTFSVRTSPNSNVAVQLVLGADGTLTNVASFGTTTTANVGVDGLTWDLS